HVDLGGLPVEALLLVADLLDGGAGHLFDLLLVHRAGFRHQAARAADFAGDHHAVGGGQRLAGHTGIGVFLQEEVQHSVGNLVADLVRMTFGNRLTGEQIGRTRHALISFVAAPTGPRASDLPAPALGARRNWDRGKPGYFAELAVRVKISRHVRAVAGFTPRSEEHTSELQSRENLVCRLLLEKKK